MTTRAENFTGRYRVTFISAGITHRTIVRSPRGTSLGSIVSNGQNVMHTIYNAAASVLADDFAFLAAEVADQDDDEFVPASLPIPAVGTVDFTSPAWSAVKRAHGLSFSGRAKGTKGRLTMWGLDINEDLATDPGANGIITPAELSFVGTVASFLQGNAATGSGAFGIWYQRATWKLNDKLLADIRRGTIS